MKCWLDVVFEHLLPRTQIDFVVCLYNNRYNIQYVLIYLFIVRFILQGNEHK